MSDEDDGWSIHGSDTVEGLDGNTVITGGSGDRLNETNEKLLSLRMQYQSIHEAEKKHDRVRDYAIEIWKLKHFQVNNEQSLESFREFMSISPTWSGVVTVDGTSTKVKKHRHKEVKEIMAKIEEKYGDTKVEVKMA